jgi:hypothetical protein
MACERFGWCRRLFASVDIVGSTAFKQHAGHSGEWAGVFRDFFREFPLALRTRFDGLTAAGRGFDAEPMSVWKFVGDEILFVAEIRRHEQVAVYASAFLGALEAYSAELKHKANLSRLGLKGTLWGAGFPVSNIEVEFPSVAAGGKVGPPDFLGPNVDHGFRLCGLADVRKVPISVDAAYMLAYVEEWTDLRVGFEEARGHKGVPLPYPFIWLDRQRGQQSAEDRLLGRRAATSPHDLREWLEEVFAAEIPNLARPFLVGDPDGRFSGVPEGMEARRQELRNRSAEEGYLEDADVAATGTRPSSPPPPEDPGPAMGIQGGEPVC